MVSWDAVQSYGDYSWVDGPEVLKYVGALVRNARAYEWWRKQKTTHTVTRPTSPRVTSLSVCIDAVVPVHNGHRPQWNHEPLTCGFSDDLGTPSRALVRLPLSGPNGPLQRGDIAGQRGCTERNYDGVLDLRYPASQSSVDMIFAPKFPVWVTP